MGIVSTSIILVSTITITAIVCAVFLKFRLGGSNDVSKQIKAIVFVGSGSALVVATATILFGVTFENLMIFITLAASYMLYGLWDILHTIQMKK